MVEPSESVAETAKIADSPVALCESDPEFFELVVSRSGENIAACYQCHKCASGCPVAPYTDYTPDKLIRLIQLGEKEKALNAKHLNTCVSCYTCAARCPNKIDGARITEALKEIAHDKHLPPARPEVQAFHDTFLMSIRHFGRVNETELMAVLTMKAGPDWSTILKSPGMFFKGRLHIWGGRIRGLKALRRLFGRKD